MSSNHKVIQTTEKTQQTEASDEKMGVLLIKTLGRNEGDELNALKHICVYERD
jgi:hypothetical protein